MHEAAPVSCMYGTARALTQWCPYSAPLRLLAVWADADTWFERQQHEEEIKKLKKEHDSTVAKAVAAGSGGGGGEEEDAEEGAPTDPMAAAEARALGN